METTRDGSTINLPQTVTINLFRQYHGDNKRWLHYQPTSDSDDSLSAVRKDIISSHKAFKYGTIDTLPVPTGAVRYGRTVPVPFQAPLPTGTVPS